MMRYALATISNGDAGRCAAIVVDDKVVVLADLLAAAGTVEIPFNASILHILENWENFEPILEGLVASGFPGLDWEDAASVDFRAPVDLPRQIFCTGANYRTHVVQMMVDTNTAPEGMEGDAIRAWAEKMMDDRLAHGEPYVFTKPITTVAGANDTLSLPANTEKPDWELELAVVIGKGGIRISREDAMQHVAGYAIVNDISARDLIPRTDYKLLGTDWLRSKGQEGFLPFGPYMVPKRFIADPYALNIRLSVEGKMMQDASTSDMMFDIARQIEYISRYSRLLPGDVICTGSPAGNGTHYDRFLQDGDMMVGEIDGLGVQRIRCISAQRG